MKHDKKFSAPGVPLVPEPRSRASSTSTTAFRQYGKRVANRMLDALVPASCFWVLVELQGLARVRRLSKAIRVNAGEALHVLADDPHRVAAASPEGG
jgi:hypothetical protein